MNRSRTQALINLNTVTFLSILCIRIEKIKIKQGIVVRSYQKCIHILIELLLVFLIVKYYVFFQYFELV